MKLGGEEKKFRHRKRNASINRAGVYCAINFSIRPFIRLSKRKAILIFMHARRKRRNQMEPHLIYSLIGKRHDLTLCACEAKLITFFGWSHFPVAEWNRSSKWCNLKFAFAIEWHRCDRHREHFYWQTFEIVQQIFKVQYLPESGKRKYFR